MGGTWGVRRATHQLAAHAVLSLLLLLLAWGTQVRGSGVLSNPLWSVMAPVEGCSAAATLAHGLCPNTQAQPLPRPLPTPQPAAEASAAANSTRAAAKPVLTAAAATAAAPAAPAAAPAAARPANTTSSRAVAAPAPVRAAAAPAPASRAEAAAALPAAAPAATAAAPAAAPGNATRPQPANRTSDPLGSLHRVLSENTPLFRSMFDVLRIQPTDISGKTVATILAPSDKVRTHMWLW